MKSIMQIKYSFVSISIIIILIIALYLINTNQFIKTAKGKERKLAIYSVETEEKKVAISFDEGWGIDLTDEILDVLDKHQVKATFFLVGAWVDTYAEDVIKIAQRGHDLGNHTDSHKRLIKLNKNKIKEEILNVHQKVKLLTGKDMTLFRPPFGEYNNTIIDIAEECNYYTIKWNVDSYDWRSKGKDEIIKSVLKSQYLKNGSIILFHNNTKYTKEAVDTILSRLKKQNYEIVPISELIMKNNYYIDATGRQFSREIN